MRLGSYVFDEMWFCLLQQNVKIDPTFFQLHSLYIPNMVHLETEDFMLVALMGEVGLNQFSTR